MTSRPKGTDRSIRGALRDEVGIRPISIQNRLLIAATDLLTVSMDEASRERRWRSVYSSVLLD